MKWNRITGFGTTSLTCGLVVAYGTRWIYVHTLEKDPAYTLICGSIVTISWVVALIGVCICTVVAIRDGVRQTTAEKRLKHMTGNSEQSHAEATSESARGAAPEEPDA